MDKFKELLRQFFFPPEGTPLWQKILPYAILGVLTLVVLFAAAYGWEYTNSPEFCGTVCHTMPPEYTAYLTSPHARIDCVDCHIGEGFITTRVTRKAGDIKHVVKTITHAYEFPITADDMRPARQTCELCHFPQKFSDDSLREIRSYDQDLFNTPKTTYLVLKTGGGAKRLGLGQGIHWHIENEIYYYPVDHSEQEIPYIQVIEDDGSKVEYIDVESGINPDEINVEDLKEMDCITCHNRITHLVEPPEKILDTMLQRGVISSDIPEIKRVAVEVFYRDYSNSPTALANIDLLEKFYQTYYPTFFEQNLEKIIEAITALKEAYTQSVYPEQESDWDSHPNNVGHQFSPGCFRCHDGKHLNADQEAVRLECNICHAIPVVVRPGDFTADIEISRGPEPSTHLNPHWIGLHRDVFDQTCQNCHTVEDPGGISNTSFCSNSACHGYIYEFAGFDAPALRAILLQQIAESPDLSQEAEITEDDAEQPVDSTEDTPDTPPETTEAELDIVPIETPVPLVDENPTFQNSVGEIFQRQCTSCHGSSGGLAELNLSTYEGVMAGSQSGAVIIPGNPQASLLIQIQTSEQGHFNQFSPLELSLIESWINDGAPEN